MENEEILLGRKYTVIYLDSHVKILRDANKYFIYNHSEVAVCCILTDKSLVSKRIELSIDPMQLVEIGNPGKDGLFMILKFQYNGKVISKMCIVEGH